MINEAPIWRKFINDRIYNFNEQVCKTSSLITSLQEALYKASYVYLKFTMIYTLLYNSASGEKIDIGKSSMSFYK